MLTLTHQLLLVGCVQATWKKLNGYRSLLMLHVVAKQVLAFAKYPPLVKLERRHGVPVGSTYATEPSVGWLLGKPLNNRF